MNRRFLSGTPDTELGRTDSIFIPLSSPKRTRPNANAEWDSDDAICGSPYEYVLTDYRSSSTSSAVFDFELPTEFWVDVIHRLEMLAITRAEAGIPSYTTQRVGIDLTFADGIAFVPPNTNSFTRSQGRPVNAGEAFTVAAVDDGASGEPNATAVTDMLVAQDPNLFLYLGDVYEKGTRTEFHNWYGDESRQWGRLALNYQPNHR